ncbi:MAG: 2OG-Fe(II) oxygenase [Hyphomicrobiaceae bacterium]
MAKCNEASEIEVGVEELGKAGYSVSLGLLPLELVVSLVAELRRRELGDELAPARIGRDSVQMLGGIVRQAQSSWLKDQSAAERHFLAFAERVRLAINRRLILGLFDFEAQFLLYPVGGFYRRHIDALHGERNRVVSMVAYLNEDWTSEDGGMLALWNAGGIGNPVVEVLPLAGTVVLMLSEQIPHEARVAIRERRAIAGWFRINSSSADRVDFPR